MTKSEVEDYYNEWAKIGYVYQMGDYFDIFKSSDLMITDCASFLAEYLPSKKPLIRLIKDNSIEMSDLGSKIVSQYYNARNKKEIEYLFQLLAVEKNDYKKKEREKLVVEIVDFNESASNKIYKYILKSISEVKF